MNQKIKELREIMKLKDYEISHLRCYYQGDVSSLAKKTLKICAVVFDGLHNTNSNILKNTDWSQQRQIRISTFLPMGTYDNNMLTTLVFMAHDLAVRVEITPCNFRYFSINFSERKRSGSMFERHPTLEKAVKDWK